MNWSELCTHFLKSKICRCSYSSWHGGICATAYSSVSCPLQKLLGLWNFSCKLTFILQRVIHALFIRGMCLRLFSNVDSFSLQWQLQENYFFSNEQCAQVKTCLANWKWQTITCDLTDFSCAQFVSFLYFFQTQYRFAFKSNMNIHGVQWVHAFINLVLRPSTFPFSAFVHGPCSGYIKTNHLFLTVLHIINRLFCHSF